MQYKSINFKRGDTLTIECTRRDADGTPVDLTGLTIASKVRNGGFEDTLTVTVVDAGAGTFTLAQTATLTALWPISAEWSDMLCDVEFVDGANVVSSETFAINVLADITY